MLWHRVSLVTWYYHQGNLCLQQEDVNHEMIISENCQDSEIAEQS